MLTEHRVRQLCNQVVLGSTCADVTVSSLYQNKDFTSVTSLLLSRGGQDPTIDKTKAVSKYFLIMMYLKECFTQQDYVPVLANPDYIFHLNDDLKSANELQYAKV